MIISHSRKFIFIKPRKVAGTSVEVALAQYCGEEDIITENVLLNEIDETTARDFRRNDTGFFNHMRSKRIKKQVGEKIWNSYYKISIVRNPWDMLVSRYFWNKKNATPRKSVGEVCGEILKAPSQTHLYGKLFFAMKRTLLREEISPEDSFDAFLKKLPHNASNTSYYFDDHGKPYCDFVIRFEHLQEDFDTVCEHLELPHTEIPQLKTKVRTSRDYTSFYTSETRAWVEKEFAQEINAFGYTFE
ncbi:MAG: sulfotransferase family protein [Candidatus Kerfeldbacteria bacterium]|nr:sulfotransferase family protein [Candidatus Kerfeldbacteria bacterium]